MVTYTKFINCYKREKSNKQVSILQESITKFLENYPQLVEKCVFHEASQKIRINLISRDFPDWQGLKIITLQPKTQGGKLRMKIKKDKVSFQSSVEKTINLFKVFKSQIKKICKAIDRTNNLKEVQMTINQNLQLPIAEEMIDQYLPDTNLDIKLIREVLNFVETHQRSPWRCSFLIFDDFISLFVHKNQQLKRIRLRKTHKKLDKKIEQLFELQVRYVDDKELMNDPNYNNKDIPQKMIMVLDTDSTEISL